MTIARKDIINVEYTPYYHCTSQCVRQSFLCGFSALMQKDYSHRREWIVNRMHHLASIFAIEVCSYSIMENHYHLVLHINPKEAKLWTDAEVIQRWKAIFSQHKHTSNQEELEGTPDVAPNKIETYRERLQNISWFMRFMNEYIARLSNKEDGCKGRFWSGRFTSQALLDEAAVLACMSYVELNPIRAKRAKTLEKSEYTSIQERTKEHVNQQKTDQTSSELMSIIDSSAKRKGPPLPFKRHLGLTKLPITLSEYLELVDWTGRAIHPDKRGVIPNHIKPILTRLQVNSEKWPETINQFESEFCHFVGRSEKLSLIANKLSQRFPRGITRARDFYLEPSPS